ncbi:MAG: hypothetical protein EP340_05100 [Alphaproteobacteria bacterium]|nr:MAG: hypothetical protein EP340_05100 [Alphaproteobacteria bacterium]
MQFLIFTVVAVALYFFANGLLGVMERRRGKPFADRSLIFFGILLVSAVLAFKVIQIVAG